VVQRKHQKVHGKSFTNFLYKREYVLVIHGFTTQEIALQFEWVNFYLIYNSKAWQNPNSTRHLKDFRRYCDKIDYKLPAYLNSRNRPRHTTVSAIVSMLYLLNVDPFDTLSLTIHLLDSSSFYKVYNMKNSSNFTYDDLDIEKHGLIKFFPKEFKYPRINSEIVESTLEDLMLIDHEYSIEKEVKKVLDFTKLQVINLTNELEVIDLCSE
jgi:hypothetical protein